MKEKNSVFHGHIFPVISEKEAHDILYSLRKRYYDASHHCYCYKFPDRTFRYSDDGEPSGTAGIRIMNAIEHFDLNSILVVVIRYFGGIKLGVGPLGKAYYDSAIEVLSSAEIIIKKEFQKVCFISDFSNINHVFRILSHYDTKKIDTTYSDNVEISCFLETHVVEEINSKLAELTNGSMIVKFEGLPVFL